MTRSEALGALADLLLASVPDVAKLIELLDQTGGCGKVTAALRERLIAPSPLTCAATVKPDPAVWDAASDAVIGGDKQLAPPRFTGPAGIPSTIAEAVFDLDTIGLFPLDSDALLNSVERWERWINGPPLSSLGRRLAFLLRDLPDAERQRVISKIIELRS